MTDKQRALGVLLAACLTNCDSGGGGVISASCSTCDGTIGCSCTDYIISSPEGDIGKVLADLNKVCVGGTFMEFSISAPCYQCSGPVCRSTWVKGEGRTAVTIVDTSWCLNPIIFDACIRAGGVSIPRP